MKAAEHLLWLTSQIAATMAKDSTAKHASRMAREVMADLLGVDELDFEVVRIAGTDEVGSVKSIVGTGAR